MGLLCLACAIVGGSITAAAQSSNLGNLFTAAGFKVRYADTPEKLNVLRSLPPNKLVIKKRKGKTLYVYADPTMCVCAYVGTPGAYAAFRDAGLAQGGGTFDGTIPNNEQQMIDSMNEDDAAGPDGTFSAQEDMFGNDY